MAFVSNGAFVVTHPRVVTVSALADALASSDDARAIPYVHEVLARFRDGGKFPLLVSWNKISQAFEEYERENDPTYSHLEAALRDIVACVVTDELAQTMHDGYERCLKNARVIELERLRAEAVMKLHSIGDKDAVKIVFDTVRDRVKDDAEATHRIEELRKSFDSV